MRRFLIGMIVCICFAQPLFAAEEKDGFGFGLTVGNAFSGGTPSVGFAMNYDWNISSKFQVSFEGAQRFTDNGTVLRFLTFGLIPGKKSTISVSTATASLRFTPTQGPFYIGAGTGAFHGNMYYSGMAGYRTYRDGTFVFGEFGVQGAYENTAYYTMNFRFASPSTDTGTFVIGNLAVADRAEGQAVWDDMLRNSVITFSVVYFF